MPLPRQSLRRRVRTAAARPSAAEQRVPAKPAVRTKQGSKRSSQAEPSRACKARQLAQRSERERYAVFKLRLRKTAESAAVMPTARLAEGRRGRTDAELEDCNTAFGEGQLLDIILAVTAQPYVRLDAPLIPCTFGWQCAAAAPTSLYCAEMRGTATELRKARQLRRV